MHVVHYLLVGADYPAQRWTCVICKVFRYQFHSGLCDLSHMSNCQVFSGPGPTTVQDPGLRRSTWSRITVAFWKIFCSSYPRKLVAGNSFIMPMKMTRWEFDSGTTSLPSVKVHLWRTQQRPWYTPSSCTEVSPGFRPTEFMICLTAYW